MATFTDGSVIEMTSEEAKEAMELFDLSRRITTHLQLVLKLPDNRNKEIPQERRGDYLVRVLL